MTSISLTDIVLRYPLVRGFKLSQLTARKPKAAGAGGAVDPRFNARDGFAALNGVTFELGAGDRLGLIGPNGAGKTTLLKVLHGIYAPNSGTMAVTGRTDALFNVSLGFRQEASGRRNIEFRGMINGWSKAQIDERIPEIIEFSELGEFIDMPYKTYSQGMAARLAFAAATAFQPEILLMDEWIGAGDISFQDKASKRLISVVQSAGIVVIASHAPHILRNICNKGLYLKDGKVEMIGPIDDALKAAGH